MQPINQRVTDEQQLAPAELFQRWKRYLAVCREVEKTNTLKEMEGGTIV